MPAVSPASTFSLAYGKGRLRVVPPAGRFASVVAAVPPPLADPARSLLEALEGPIEAPPLRALVRPGDRATIVVSDGTRITGIRELLPPLLAYLQSAGISIWKVDPLPSSLTNQRRPPCSAAIARATANPRPIPPD